MKASKKIIALLLAAVLVIALVGCSKSDSKSDAKADSSADSKDTLIMATNAAFPPYEFISDEDGKTIVGIDAEIAGKIAEELGYTLQIEDMEFSSIITAVQTGKVDIGMAGMTVTEDRLKNVNFSTSYATGVQSIIVTEDSAIASPDDLAGVMIGVQESTTGHIYCEDDFGAENVTAYATGASAVQALLAGKVDCVVIDNQPAKAFVDANEGLKILDTEYVTEDYAIAVSKDNEELLNSINEILDKMIADGTVQSILDKYISAD